MAEGLKLNLGCGRKPMAGFLNVDFVQREGVDAVHDLTKPLPWGDCDEIHAYHVFEHFYRYECEEILANWVAALRPGGRLVLEMPCLDKIINLFQYHIAKKQPVGPWVVWGLYGDPSHRDPAMCHRWCYSTAEIRSLMERAGLQVMVKDPQTHNPHRDMRLEGRKGSIIV